MGGMGRTTGTKLRDCKYFVIFPNAGGRLRLQTDDGAARAASCFIPAILSQEWGLFFVFQWNVVF